MVEREIQEHITVWRAPLDRKGERTVIVTLTKRGRELLESHRSRHSESSQTFFAGAAKSRELSHDAQLCRAYMRAAEKLRAQGARVQRVVLDYELKREYQTFLQERNRARAESDGRPDRSREEIKQWAIQHDLPIVNDRVQFSPSTATVCPWPLTSASAIRETMQLGQTDT